MKIFKKVTTLAVLLSLFFSIWGNNVNLVEATVNRSGNIGGIEVNASVSAHKNSGTASTRSTTAVAHEITLVVEGYYLKNDSEADYARDYDANYTVNLDARAVLGKPSYNRVYASSKNIFLNAQKGSTITLNCRDSYHGG